MLQFLTHKSDKYSIAEEAQMAIEGGCGWIQITDSLNDDGADKPTLLKEVVLSVKPLCEENEAFLIVDHDVALVNELKVHGVHLAKDDMEPRQAREELGPHAIIGVDAANLDDILALKGVDVDYVVLAPYGQGLTVDDYRNIIAQARANGSELPIVARGEISADDIKPLIEAGASGIALSKAILSAPDPVKATADIVKTLLKGE